MIVFSLLWIVCAHNYVYILSDFVSIMFCIWEQEKECGREVEISKGRSSENCIL